MEKFVHYVVESGSSLANKQGIKALYIKVGTVDLAALGRHASLQHQFREEFAKTLGIKVTDLRAEEVQNAPPHTRRVFELRMQWAHIHVAIRKVEAQFVPREIVHSADESPSPTQAAWRQVTLADLGWDSAEGMETLPMDLFTALDREVHVCNPRVFGGQVDDEGEKKEVGLIAVTSSDTLIR